MLHAVPPGGSSARRRVTRRVCAALALGLVVAAGRAGPATAAGSSPAAVQLALAAGAAVKVGVSETGWTRVTRDELLAAGLDPQVDARTLQLFSDGIEQALRVTGNGDATLDAGEAIEFYGQARDTLWTGTRTYWLVSGGGAGRGVPFTAYAAGSAPPAVFAATARLRGHGTYYAGLLNGDDSNFFTAALGTTPVKETVTVAHPAAVPNARLRLSLTGVTSGDHALPVSFDGAALGTCAFTGQVAFVCELPLSSLTAGDHEVALLTQGPPPDFALLGTVELTYDHPFTADGDALTLTAPPGTRVVIDGFTTADARVVDVTDPSAPIELVARPSFDGASFVVSADTPGETSPRLLHAFTPATARRPTSLAANRPSTWGDARDGEVVILTPAAFLDAARPLAARRAREGFSVALVDVQDVYDGFGGGDKSAFAIRSFLRQAHDHWRVPPRFVVLVGDATFDPRNFLGKGDFDFLPTKLIDTQEIETASDDWFVDWNDDGVPELAVGRLSVRTPAEAALVVEKQLDYAGLDDRARGALFVADTPNDGLDFVTASELSAAVVTDRLPTDHFYRAEAGAAAAATLLAKLETGPFLVNYFGHGSVEQWDGTLTGAAASALGNLHLSIYVSMNCLNGFFHDLYTDSLAERLLKAPAGGAVAVWASSTLTSFASQAALDREFLKRLGRTSLGEAAVAAKQAIADADTRRTWILFGDPTLFGEPLASTADASADADADADASADAPPADASPPPDDTGPASGAAGADGGLAPADAPAGDAPRADARDAAADGDSGPRPPAQPGAGCGCALAAPTGPGAAATVLLLAALGARLGRGARRRDARRLKFRRRSPDRGVQC
jgi:hypothetical protein